VRFYMQYSYSRTGYHAGTGGVISIALHDNDAGGGNVPANAELTRSIIDRPTANGKSPSPFPLATFASPVRVSKGELKHVVFTNIDPAASPNYISLTSLAYNSATRPSPQQPSLDDLGWHQLIKMGSKAWASRDTASKGGVFTPLMEVRYAD